MSQQKIKQEYHIIVIISTKDEWEFRLFSDKDMEEKDITELKEIINKSLKK